MLDEIDCNRKIYRDGFLSWIDILQTYGADKMGEEFVCETNRIFSKSVIWPTLFEGLPQKENIEDHAVGHDHGKFLDGFLPNVIAREFSYHEA